LIQLSKLIDFFRRKCKGKRAMIFIIIKDAGKEIGILYFAANHETGITPILLS
jgi:hypothetical protein